MDVRQSDLWSEFMKRLGWETTKVSSGLAYSKKVLLGSIVKIPKLESPINVGQIDLLAKDKKALFVKLEPAASVSLVALKKSLEKAGFSSDRWSLQPTKTLIIRLTDSPEQILARMEKDTRYSIRAAEKRGVQVKETNDLEVFWKLYSETSKRGGFWVTKKELETLWEVFKAKGKAVILVAYYNKEPLAASFLLFHDQIAYYYHAGSSQQHRDLFATYLVVWQSILEAKKKGCTKFDLMGIVDPRIPSTKNWGGFSHFKKGFGGEEFTYLGSFIKVYHPILKPIFFFNRFF